MAKNGAKHSAKSIEGGFTMALTLLTLAYGNAVIGKTKREGKAEDTVGKDLQSDENATCTSIDPLRS